VPYAGDPIVDNESYSTPTPYGTASDAWSLMASQSSGVAVQFSLSAGGETASNVQGDLVAFQYTFDSPTNVTVQATFADVGGGGSGLVSFYGERLPAYLQPFQDFTGQYFSNAAFSETALVPAGTYYFATENYSTNYGGDPDAIPQDNFTSNVTLSFAAVPEPSSVLLFISGGFLVLNRRNRQTI
jgi:hypothetical protein